MQRLLSTRWISESTDVWHIACPGPSLNFDRIPDDGNPVACINVALKLATRCDFWVCWDSPNNIHEQAFPQAWQYRPILVTGTVGSVCGWYELMSQSRLWTWDRWLSVVTNGKPWGPPWYMEATSGPNLSVFNAIGWALQHGGTDIRLYGCDMSGVGYCDPDATKLRFVEQKPEKRWKKRWSNESSMYEKARQAGRKRGVRIARSLPDGSWDW